MTVANPREVPEYELNPLELHVRKSNGISKTVEGVQPFHPKSPEEVVRLMCVEGKRPKHKSKSYPADLIELIEQCWNPQYDSRPSFAEVIARLDKIILNCNKQGWKDTFRLPW